MEELSSDANQIHCDIRLQVRMRSIRDAFLFYNLNTLLAHGPTPLKFEIELQTVLNQLLNLVCPPHSTDPLRTRALCRKQKRWQIIPQPTRSQGK